MSARWRLVRSFPAHFCTFAATAVCLERRCSLGVLSEEVRTYNSTPPWTTLVTSRGENSVSVMCSGASLSQRYCTFIPRWDPSEVCWRRCTSATLVCCHVDTGRAANATRHTWWPRLPGGSGTCLECPAVVCQGRSIVAAVPPGTEDDTVSCDLRLKTALQLLLTIILYSAPATVLWQCHFNLCICMYMYVCIYPQSFFTMLLVPISLFGYLPVFSYCEMTNGRTCLLPLGFALDFL